MTEGARYVKIVEWSDEDHCFVGSCPGLFYGGCHGDDEKAVFAELCDIVDETAASSSSAAFAGRSRSRLKHALARSIVVRRYHEHPHSQSSVQHAHLLDRQPDLCSP